MKKGNLEIKEDMDDSFVFRANNYSVYRIGNMQDLKDLRSLIDTVLKEERKIGGHTYSKSGKDMCCQPLTEGEDRCKCGDKKSDHYPLVMSDEHCEEVGGNCSKCSCDSYEESALFKPQESNKEEMGKGCYTDKLGQLVHDIPHTCQEPSKKPSERIEEFAKNSVGFAENIGGKVDGIIKILDELHESGKI